MSEWLHNLASGMHKLKLWTNKNETQVYQPIVYNSLWMTQFNSSYKLYNKVVVIVGNNFHQCHIQYDIPNNEIAVRFFA